MNKKSVLIHHFYGSTFSSQLEFVVRQVVDYAERSVMLSRIQFQNQRAYVKAQRECAAHHNTDPKARFGYKPLPVMHEVCGRFFFTVLVLSFRVLVVY